MTADRDRSDGGPSYEPPQLLRLSMPKGSAACQDGSGAGGGSCASFGNSAGVDCMTGEAPAESCGTGNGF